MPAQDLAVFLGEATMWRYGLRIGVSAAMLPLCAVAAAEATEKRPADAIAEMFANADKPAQPPPSPTAKPTRPNPDYEMDMLRRARAEATERGASAKNSMVPRAELSKLPADQPGPAPKAPKSVETLQNRSLPNVATKSSPAFEPAPSAMPAPAPIAAPTAIKVNVTTSAARPSVDTKSASNATVFRIQILKPGARKSPALIADATQPNATNSNELTKPLQALAPDPGPASSAPPSERPAATHAPTAAQPPVAGYAPSGARATILVVLQGGSGTPDPILCLGDTCAISAGLSTPARMLPRAEALALKSTRDTTVDPCFAKTGCAFRDVPLAADAILQIVSIGSGDAPKAGDGFSIALDATCKRNGGQLECGRPLETTDFVAWIIPEAIAKESGAPALEAAIAEGLSSSEIAQTTDK